MDNIFNKMKHVIHSDFTLLQSFLFESDTTSEPIEDKNGKLHYVSTRIQKPLSFSDGIDKNLSADTLNLETCLENHFNLDEIPPISLVSSEPENVTEGIDFQELSDKIFPKQKVTEKQPSEPTTDPINSNNN